MNSTAATAARSRWVEAWPDALAFVGGLAVAWFARWQTTDLVWSLWLSSLVVGYAMILWSSTGMLREFAVGAGTDRTPGTLPGKLLVGSLIGGGSLMMIAFFTVHFGGFHFGHSVFLNQFFPVLPEAKTTHLWPGFETYAEVVKRYWIFLPVAFLAERAAFASKPAKPKDDGAVTAEAIAARKARNAQGDALFAPYKNVIRMHLLIFFFAGASFAKFDNFAIYAVVYAVYFFPWRLLGKEKTGA
jgi:hypothetical protein